jgi:hypothetical protein
VSPFSGREGASSGADRLLTESPCKATLSCRGSGTANDSSSDSWFARKVVIHRTDAGRLVSEHANHADDLAATHCGMIEHVPEDFPALLQSC